MGHNWRSAICPQTLTISGPIQPLDEHSSAPRKQQEKQRTPLSVLCGNTTNHPQSRAHASASTITALRRSSRTTSRLKPLAATASLTVDVPLPSTATVKNACSAFPSSTGM